jgi:hypothetical protein
MPKKKLKTYRMEWKTRVCYFKIENRESEGYWSIYLKKKPGLPAQSKKLNAETSRCNAVRAQQNCSNDCLGKCAQFYPTLWKSLCHPLSDNIVG